MLKFLSVLIQVIQLGGDREWSCGRGVGRNPLGRYSQGPDISWWAACCQLSSLWATFELWNEISKGNIVAEYNCKKLNVVQSNLNTYWDAGHTSVLYQNWCLKKIYKTQKILEMCAQFLGRNISRVYCSYSYYSVSYVSDYALHCTWNDNDWD